MRQLSLPFIAGQGPTGLSPFQGQGPSLDELDGSSGGLLCAKNSHPSSLQGWSTEEPVRSRSSRETQQGDGPGLFLKGVPGPSTSSQLTTPQGERGSDIDPRGAVETLGSHGESH